MNTAWISGGRGRWWGGTAFSWFEVWSDVLKNALAIGGHYAGRDCTPPTRKLGAKGEKKDSSVCGIDQGKSVNGVWVYKLQKRDDALSGKSAPPSGECSPKWGVIGVKEKHNGADGGDFPVARGGPVTNLGRGTGNGRERTSLKGDGAATSRWKKHFVCFGGMGTCRASLDACERNRGLRLDTPGQKVFLRGSRDLKEQG